MYDIDFTNNFQKIPPPRLRNDITTFFPLFFSFLDKMTHSLKYVQHWSPKKNLTVSQNLQIYISRSLVANILFAVHEKPLLTVFSLFFFFYKSAYFLTWNAFQMWNFQRSLAECKSFMSSRNIFGIKSRLKFHHTILHPPWNALYKIWVLVLVRGYLYFPKFLANRMHTYSNL